MGNRVPAVAAPRVASTQPADGEPGAVPGAVDLEGLGGVRGAAGLETTGRGPTFAELLVLDHQPVQGPRERAHDDACAAERRVSRASRRRTTSFLSSSGVRRTASGPAEMSRAPGGSTGAPDRCTSAQMARRRLRSRLRTTAPPTRLVMAKATRGGPTSASARWVADSEPRRTRTPSARRAKKVRRSPMGWIRPTAWPGP